MLVEASLRSPESADLLGFFHTLLSLGFVHNGVKNKEHSVSINVSGRNIFLIREHGGKWPDRKAVVTHIATLYSHGEQKRITKGSTLKLMGCNSRKTHQVLLLSAENLRLNCPTKNGNRIRSWFSKLQLKRNPKWKYFQAKISEI